MLINKKLFNDLEVQLRDNGTINMYENQEGPITGRMMITHGKIPADLNIDRERLEEKYGRIQVFDASFDFCDSIVGVDLAASPLMNGLRAWITPQNGTSEPVPDDLLERFMSVLSKNAHSDGSYSLPLCTFITKEKEYTVIPDIV